MQSDIQITNRNDTCFVDIEGVIGVPEEWQFDQPSSRVATYEKFRDSLDRLREIDAPEIVVNIRSTGGDVNDALLIYEALSSLDGHIVTRCYGYTASAATVIAQAASEGCREISAHALYLIHNSICTAEGNAEELATRIDLLRKTDARLAEVYAARSGRTPEEFTLLMAENNGSGRWLSPQEALAAGLVDRIIEPSATEKRLRHRRRRPDNGASCSASWDSSVRQTPFPQTATSSISATRKRARPPHFGTRPARRPAIRGSDPHAPPRRSVDRRNDSLGQPAGLCRRCEATDPVKPARRGSDIPPSDTLRKTATPEPIPFVRTTHSITKIKLSHERTRKCQNLHRQKPRNDLFRPMLSGPSAIDLGVRVLYNMPVPTTVQMWEPKTDILQKFTAAGWSGGAGSKNSRKPSLSTA